MKGTNRIALHHMALMPDRDAPLKRYRVTLQRVGKRPVVRYVYAASDKHARELTLRSPHMMRGAFNPQIVEG